VARVFPVSALADVGAQIPKNWCVENLPLGPTLYPKDTVSEHPERFFIAEIIREKIFLQYQQEIPYAAQVWVQSHKERDGVRKDLIVAKVFVERKSQMGIVIGNGGKALKKLSTAARVDIEKFLGRPVYLDLGVKVGEGWRSDDAALNDLGLDDPNRLEQNNLGPAPDVVG
jgi:GTP-binding protein Era